MGSSSKKKHSKKKSSKLSSKARKLKKSKRTKAKKLGRRHDSSTDSSMSSYSSDSYSSNSDDDSISSKSLSSSSSKDNHRRKSNARSRSIKKRKKKARRRSSSSEDNRDLSRSRKRKRSKKYDDSKSRKKTKRKELRRGVDTGPASSDSHSCSTCNDSASESSERERIRRRSRKNKDHRRDKGKGKLQSTLSPRRSPSHSSYSDSRDENHINSQSEESYMSQKRRLKSVIVFPEKTESCIRDLNESEKDMQKEELFYDHKDYPSKSSSGEGGKKMSPLHPANIFDGSQSIDNVGYNSDNEVIEQSEVDAHEHDHIRNPFSNEFETNSYEKESALNILLPDSGSFGNDLEAVLKQKALENLKKFRGARKSIVKPTANENDRVNGDRNGSSSSPTEIVQSKFPNPGSAEVEKVALVGELTRKVSGIAEQSPDYSPDVVHCGKPNGMSRAIRRSVLGKSAIENSSFGDTTSPVDSTLNSTRSSVVSVGKSHLETETDLRNHEPRKAEPKSPSSSTGQGAASTSALVESAASEKQTSNNQAIEAKDGSQYQQKTMTVMRNGEMVQVNYKVYIPQRAPALARRQFKR